MKSVSLNHVADQKLNNNLDKYDVLCDNCASVSVIRERTMLENIRPAERPVIITGVGDSSIKADVIGDFYAFGKPLT
eukprot:9213316-Lingulodinium_polyedra.AAC.1